ncbi:MAG: hypothetical protein ACOH1Y_09395 [Propionicimonas sp.]
MPTMVLRVLAALVLTLLAVVAAPVSVACACSCAALDTDQAMRGASAVFAGTVVARSRPTGGYSNELIEYTIEVSRVYQGSVPAEVVVRSAVSGASCGAELAGQVTVFAQGAIDGLFTTSCSAPATIDRSRLGAGHPPAAATPPPEPLTTTDFDGAPLMMLAGLLGLAGVAIWMVRRPRR